MNNTLKTSIAASLALLISFAMLFTYLNLYGNANSVDIGNEKLSSVMADSGEKRVFLLGSSYVERLNSTYIKQYISENGLQQFQVYNIAKNGAGNPSQQIRFLDSIVSSHPAVVVYGIGFRELGYKPYMDNIPKCASVEETPSKNNNETSFSTPSIQDAITYIQKEIPLQTDYFSNLPDPKHVTVDLLKSYFDKNTTITEKNSTISSKIDQNLFEKRDPLFTEIKSLDEINKPLGYVVRVCPDDMNNELTKLKEMVTTLKNNNVDVILYIPPFSSSYLNAVGNDGTQTFLFTMEKFSNDNSLKLYDLHDKYVNLNIWADAQHVAENPKVVIYSDDLANIILKELKSFTNLRVVDTSEKNLSYKDLSYTDLRSVDLSNKNMTGTSLTYSNLFGAKINGTILKESNLSYSYLRNLDLSKKDLKGTILTGADLASANLSGVDLSGKDLTGTNLSGVDLSGKDLTGTNLRGANLAKANLTGVDLSGKDLTGTNLSGVDLSRTDLTGTILVGSDMEYANLRDVDLTGKNLTGTSLKGVYLSGKNLTGTILIGSNLAYTNLLGDDLTGKNLTGAFLFRTNFNGANLERADLTGDNLRKTILIGTNLNNAILRNSDLLGNNLTKTQMVGTDLHNAVLAGVNLANKDLEGTILVGANLINANLYGVDLSGKDLTGTNLRGANLDHAILVNVNLGLKNLTDTSFQGADLTRATLWKSKLINTNLVDANLSHSDLRNATLKNSNLTNADLTGANLSGANLSGTVLTGTILIGANLVNANLTGVDISNAITNSSGIGSIQESHYPELQRKIIVDDFQSKNGWIKQSSSGNQSYDHMDFINGSQSMKLVTAGNGSPTVTHSRIFSPVLDLNGYTVNSWIKIDDTSKLKELWFYFSSDNFKSSWYTYKVQLSNQIKSGEWYRISINPQEFTSGSPDIHAINRIQIRINDDSTDSAILHINEISAQKVISK